MKSAICIEIQNYAFDEIYCRVFVLCCLLYITKRVEKGERRNWEVADIRTVEIVGSDALCHIRS